MSPETISFDYSDFMEPVTVTIAAVDDDVQEAHLQHDSIVATVTSGDSITECETASAPRVCAQAVSYNGFAGAPAVNVSVIDEDFAGVVISRAEVVASYDNFGDPLLIGAYTISLASQPTRSVVVSMFSSSPYTAVFPSENVAINPETWRTPVTVYVSASAPTFDRPACPSGGRYCDVLGFSDDDDNQVSSRVDHVTHSVRSEDKFYAALTSKFKNVDSVDVAVSLVRDSVDPPILLNAALGDLTNTVYVIFHVDTNRAGLLSNFPCSVVLNLTADEESSLFGRGSECLFTDRSTLAITFGDEAALVSKSVEPRVFSIRDNVIRSHGDVVSLFASNTTFEVERSMVRNMQERILEGRMPDLSCADDCDEDCEKFDDGLCGLSCRNEARTFIEGKCEQARLEAPPVSMIAHTDQSTVVATVLIYVHAT